MEMIDWTALGAGLIIGVVIIGAVLWLSRQFDHE